LLKTADWFGIITQKDIDEAAPMPSARTSAYEFHFFLSKMKVKEVMKRDPVILSSDTPLKKL
jgi:acetoin utilization protein AcuB